MPVQISHHHQRHRHQKVASRSKGPKFKVAISWTTSEYQQVSSISSVLPTPGCNSTHPSLGASAIHCSTTFFTKKTNNCEINIHTGVPAASLTSFHASQTPQQEKTSSLPQQKQRPAQQTNGVAMLVQLFFFGQQNSKPHSFNSIQLPMLQNVYIINASAAVLQKKSALLSSTQNHNNASKTNSRSCSFQPASSSNWHPPPMHPRQIGYRISSMHLKPSARDNFSRHQHQQKTGQQLNCYFFCFSTQRQQLNSRGKLPQSSQKEEPENLSLIKASNNEGSEKQNERSSAYTGGANWQK
ncbi:hypothetical protein Nepgr_017437 [Nepenthes gracilis]|uniref:Uncharacterized protein n=1 Tax=Nepenthes gracilis TaxID=150966 RepID=A0AAD3SS15_NEPGR|nr:hypothetical protein Nepgr_017437 [Nepenthes gracilis]